MSANTKIEWTDATFNGWIGCTEVSTEESGGGGCDNCYARTLDNLHKWGGATHWGPGVPRMRTSSVNWQKPLRWNRLAAEGLLPDGETPTGGRRPRVFCHSLADVFDNEVPDEWRVDLFRLIERTTNLDWLLLTKRIGNVPRMLPVDWGDGWSNVWLGITVVNQPEADRDVSKLLAIPARVRFLSCEPLLGPIMLTSIAFRDGDPRHKQNSLTGEASLHCTGIGGHPDFTTRTEPIMPRLQWVISGGESGPKARPSHPDWHRSLRDQCEASGVQYLFKQWGEWAPCELHPPGTARTAVVLTDGRLLEGKRVIEERHDERAEIISRFGKKAAGRELDGRTHDGFPT